MKFSPKSMFKKIAKSFNFNRKLSFLELRAICDFTLTPHNCCEKISEKRDKNFMGEGLTQTLYLFHTSGEYIFIAKQKGYIIDAVIIASDEIDAFISLWEQGKLTPTGHLKN